MHRQMQTHPTTERELIMRYHVLYSSTIDGVLYVNVRIDGVTGVICGPWLKIKAQYRL